MLTKVHIVKAMVSQRSCMVVESWTIKKAECQRIDAFELWCWRGLLRIPWKARRSNQSILRNLSTHWKDWCWSSSILATWCKQPTHWKSFWCWERLRAEEGGKGWDGWMESPMQWIWTWANFRRWWGTGGPGVLQSMESQKSQTWLCNWTTKKYILNIVPEDRKMKNNS